MMTHEWIIYSYGTGIEDGYQPIARFNKDVFSDEVTTEIARNLQGPWDWEFQVVDNETGEIIFDTVDDKDEESL